MSTEKIYQPWQWDNHILGLKKENSNINESQHSFFVAKKSFHIAMRSSKMLIRLVNQQRLTKVIIKVTLAKINIYIYIYRSNNNNLKGWKLKGEK